MPLPAAFRRLLVAAATFTAISPLPGAATAESVGGIGADERLVVRGMRRIDPERLRRALADDPDLVWLSRPSDSREAFVAAVAAKATMALERAGFAAPRVAATIESSDGVERLAIDVEEGERFTAGRIEVSGLPEEAAARLVARLSEPQPRGAAVPRTADRPRAVTATVWSDARGRPASLADPQWVPGGPAAFDVIAADSTRAAVARFLRDEGYLAIAAPPERTSSALPRRGAASVAHSTWNDASGQHDAFDVSLRRKDGVADLVVAIKELPPHAILRDVELPGTCRTSKRDLAAYLGIVVGTAVTERDRARWRQALRRSGRFIRHEVELRVDPEDPAAVVARFDLDEYPRATPLAEPPTPAEATMLRFHDWVVGAFDRDGLIIDVRRRSAGAASAAATRLVVTPQGGLVLTALTGDDPACGLVVSGTQASLVPPGGTGRLDLPLPSRLRPRITVGLSLARDATASRERPAFNHAVSFGYGIVDGAQAAAGAVAIDIVIEPVACLAMVHEGDPQVSCDDGTLVVVAGAATSRFDVASGRPLGLTVAGCDVSVETKADAVAAATESLRGAAGPNQFRGDAPVTSAVECLLADGVSSACGRLAAAVGFSAVEPWAAGLERIVAAVRGCLERCLADGEIARCDRAVTAAIAAADEPDVAPLVIPREETADSTVRAGKSLARHVAAFAWQCTEDHCGRESWPASLARAAACGVVGDPAIFREMTDFMSQAEFGPLAYACAAMLAPVPTVAKSLALRGQERLSTVAFHTDCRPLLKALERHGFDDCCVSVLRSIDEESARELGRAVAGEPDLLAPLVREVRSHASHDDAVDALQAALDAWWEGSLRACVAARLDAVAAPRTAASPAGDGAPVKK